MEVLLGKFFATLVIPPGLNLSLIVFGMLLRYRFYRTGITIISISVVLLYLLSTPLISQPLASSLTTSPALDVATLAGSKAIVILGGGRNPAAPEYKEDTVSSGTLERLRYGAYLQRKTKLPILVSGGSVFGEQLAESVLMKKVLEEAFVGVAHWVEDKSTTTYENAIYTRPILEKQKIDDIVLVTHALHMLRAKEAFEQAGFNVIPAPTGFMNVSKSPWYLKIMPDARSLYASSQVMHELIGRLWYNLRHYD